MLARVAVLDVLAGVKTADGGAVSHPTNRAAERQQTNILILGKYSTNSIKINQISRSLTSDHFLKVRHDSGRNTKGVALGINLGVLWNCSV